MADLAALIDAHRKAFAELNAAIDRDCCKANDREEKAITGICAHACRDSTEGRAKARYLRRYFKKMIGAHSWHVEALLNSIAGSSRKNA